MANKLEVSWKPDDSRYTGQINVIKHTGEDIVDFYLRQINVYNKKYTSPQLSQARNDLLVAAGRQDEGWQYYTHMWETSNELRRANRAHRTADQQREEFTARVLAGMQDILKPHMEILILPKAFGSIQEFKVDGGGSTVGVSPLTVYSHDGHFSVFVRGNPIRQKSN